jgi:hypothetical protein
MRSQKIRFAQPLRLTCHLMKPSFALAKNHFELIHLSRNFHFAFWDRSKAGSSRFGKKRLFLKSINFGRQMASPLRQTPFITPTTAVQSPTTFQ